MSKSTPKMVNIAIGGIAGSALEEVAEPVIVDDDNLLLGPSSIELIRHRALRAQYWGGSPCTELDDELARTLGPILCVNLPPTPSGLLSLCRICSLALERNRNVSVVAPGAEAIGARPQGHDPAPSLYLDLDESAVLQDRPAANPWSKLQITFAATLWKLWCRRSPVAFSRFCASGGALHPQLADLGRYHAGVFPRVAQDGGLLLSRADELVLRQLSRDWLTPAKMFVQATTFEPGLGAWLSHTGDLYIYTRLLAWSRHTRGRIVEQRKEQGGRSPMTERSFRWHTGGEAILDALRSLDTAPPVEIGGAVAYNPDRAWVSRVDAIAGPYVTGRRIHGQ